MKLAVFSDIHSNYAALDTCFKQAVKQKVEGFLLLGDYVTDCPFPLKTMQLLYEIKNNYPTWMIRGNREEYLLTHHHASKKTWTASSSTGSLLYTYENLTQCDLDFFHTLPMTSLVEIDAYPKILLCHGSPMDTKEHLYANASVTDAYFSRIKEQYMFAGHTHIQEMACGRETYFLNPGSLGMPLQEDTKAQFALLEGEDKQWHIKLCQLEYDVTNLLHEFETSGLISKGKWFAKIMRLQIQTGHDYLNPCISHAHKLALHSESFVDPAAIPEKYWTEAVKQLHIPLQIEEAEEVHR